MSLPAKPSKILEMQTDFASTVANSLWIKAAQLIDYIDKSYPIGMLMMVVDTQEGNPGLPDPNHWKFMDGTIISNSNSPLNGCTFPDLRNIYLKSVKTGEAAGTVSGANTVSMVHSHTGETGFTNISNVVVTTASLTTGSNVVATAPYNHQHKIRPSDYPDLDIRPLAQQVQIYMRIL